MDPASYLNERVAAWGPYFSSAVRSLAVPDTSGIDLIPIGSGVLIWQRGARYVLTAAHVAEAFPGHAVYVGTNTSWIELPHPFYKTNPPRGKDRRSDQLDFAFAPVRDQAAESLDGCHFLDASETSPDEHVIFTPPHRSKYTVFGYPLNRFDMSYPTRTSYPKNIAFTGAIASRDEYKTLGLTVDGHIVIECDQDRVSSKKGVHSGPKLDGVSGGGIFRMPSLETIGNVARPRLAGVVIEHDRRHRLLVATRLGTILAAINTVYS
jgi:hypothetical protein